MEESLAESAGEDILRLFFGCVETPVLLMQRGVCRFWRQVATDELRARPWACGVLRCGGNLPWRTWAVLDCAPDGATVCLLAAVRGF